MPATIRSLLLFAVAAVAEIGGAWLVRQGVREHRGVGWFGAGIGALGAYGFVGGDCDGGATAGGHVLVQRSKAGRSPTSSRTVWSKVKGELSSPAKRVGDEFADVLGALRASSISTGLRAREDSTSRRPSNTEVSACPMSSWRSREHPGPFRLLGAEDLAQHLAFERHPLGGGHEVGDCVGAGNGPEFDKQWATMMIAHHEGAITMAQTVKAAGSSADVLALADAVITAQQAEITELKPITGA